MRKTISLNFIRSIMLPVILGLTVSLKAQSGYKPPMTPEAFYEKMMNQPVLKELTGESFCWNARGVGMDDYVGYYKLTKDTKWLDYGVKYYDFLLSMMDVAPDGYKGWIGPYLSDKRFYQDVLVGDALLFEGMLDFCIVVNGDANLKNKYADKVKTYVESAKRNFVEKYDKRGTWMEDGPYGGYANDDDFLKKDNMKVWVNSPRTAEVNVCHPFNKQMDAGLVCLKIFKVTGEKFYWDRAEKVFYTAKSHFQYFDNHYCWNYSEPIYAGDVNWERKNVRHGIWVHPWRSGYQANEVEKIVQAYHNGLVFNEEDIKRIINTNLKVMWNGDKVNPKFINSNGLGADGDTVGIAQFKRAYGHSNVVKNGGELWTGLLDFDQTIRDLYELRFKGDKTSDEYLHYKNTVLVNPPSFKRKYAGANGRSTVKVPEIKFTECKDLNCAVVLPHNIPKDGKSIILCQSWKGGDLSIDLYSKKGKKVGNIYTGNIKNGLFMIQWDGKDPQNKQTFKGDYKVRWTINGGCREFPVVI